MGSGRMKRELLEKYIGKKVKVTLFDKKEYIGYLYKTRTEQFKNSPNLYIPYKYYFLMPYKVEGEVEAYFTNTSCLFKCSPVIKVENIEMR